MAADRRARMRSMAKPVIAMINGYAHGAGFNLALGCDLRIAAETATLAIPFAQRGIGTGTNLLQQFVGIGKAMEWALFAKALSAREAERWGLINWVTASEELEQKTLEVAHELAEGPTTVYGYTKAAIINGWDTIPSVAYRHQGQAMINSAHTKDFKEGSRRFARSAQSGSPADDISPDGDSQPSHKRYFP